MLLESSRSAQENSYVLAWTTTPWTLPSNLALCVNPELTCALVKRVYHGSAAVPEHISMVAFRGLFHGRYLQVQNKTTNTKWIVGKEKQLSEDNQNGTLAWWSAIRTDGRGSVHPSKRTLRKCESQQCSRDFLAEFCKKAG